MFARRDTKIRAVFLHSSYTAENVMFIVNNINDL